MSLKSILLVKTNAVLGHVEGVPSLGLQVLVYMRLSVCVFSLDRGDGEEKVLDLASLLFVQSFSSGF